MSTIFIFLLILILIYLYKEFKQENFFMYNIYQQFVPTDIILGGNTRNMSYDIRGDPLVIPYEPAVWNTGTVFPIHNNNIC